MPEFFWNSGIYICGERGIRTPGPLTRSTVFKTAAIDHSAISPNAVAKVEQFSRLQKQLMKKQGIFFFKKLLITVAFLNHI